MSTSDWLNSDDVVLRLICRIQMMSASDSSTHFPEVDDVQHEEAQSGRA